MIPRSKAIARLLYHTVSRQSMDSPNLCLSFGPWRCVSKPFGLHEKWFSVSSFHFSPEKKETDKKQTVDIIKEAVTKDKSDAEKGSSILGKIISSSHDSESRRLKKKIKIGDEELSKIELSDVEKTKPKEAGTVQRPLGQSNVIKPLKKLTLYFPLKKSEKEETVRKPSIDEPKRKEEKKKITESLKRVSKKRVRVDLTVSSMERNFMTPARAMTDFLLKPKDLEGLRATKRRSPYENEPPITVYWRKDVEAKAIEVWGSKENLMKEILKRELERKFYQQNIFTTKRRLRDYRREKSTQTEIALAHTSGILGPSGRVILTAIAINGSNFLFKLFAWMYTGSHSMFSECIHSMADTINQLILAFGIHKSVQRADSHHPYGYANMKYVASLISGVGIFCVGAGLSIYHGMTGLFNPSHTESFFWAFCILFGSLVSEGATLLVAVNSIRKGALEKGMTFRQYVWRGQDPSVNVVLLEDLGAVIGVIVAASCMALTNVFDSHIPDAVGSIVIGGILGGVASFIIYTNVTALVGRSIPVECLERINAELESDVMIRAIHDVKGIDMGNCLVRYKAELDFDGRELARAYLDTQDLNKLLEEVKDFKNIDELETFILKHSENIIDMMGGEIDRIEMKLRGKFPEIRHCDLEIL